MLINHGVGVLVLLKDFELYRSYMQFFQDYLFDDDLKLELHLYVKQNHQQIFFSLFNKSDFIYF